MREQSDARCVVRPPHRPPRIAALIDHGSVTFLTGQAWDHTDITYRVWMDDTADGLALSVVHRAIGNWSGRARGLTGSPRSRLPVGVGRTREPA